MAGSNLDFTIGADTSKARVDLKLLQQELKNVNREIDNAIKAGDIAQANQLSAAYGNIEKQSIAVKNSLRAQRTETDHANSSMKELIHSGRGLGRVVSEFSNMSRGLESVTGILGNLTGGFTGGLFGVAIARGFDTLIASMDAASERLLKIRDISRETGAKPLIVQGMQELAKESGESAETANKFLTGLSSTLTKVATQTRDMQTGLRVGGKATTDLNRDFATFGDKVVQVNRGGVAVTRDFSEALAILQVKEEELIKLPREQQERRVAEAFLRTEQNAKRLGLTEIQLNAISKDIFGVPLEEADKMSKALLNIQAKNKELSDAQRGATQKNIEGAEQVGNAQEKLSQQSQDTAAVLSNNTASFRSKTLLAIADIMAAITNFRKETASTSAFKKGILEDPTFQPFGPLKEEANQLPSFFEDITKKITGFFKSIEYVPPGVPDQIQTDFSNLPPFFEGLTKTLGDIWNRFWKSLSISAQAAELDMKTAAAQANQTQAAVKGATAAAGLPTVSYGPGTGPTGGYGPASFNQQAGYGPGSFPTQSILPGVSNYQALPAKAIYPMGESASRQWTSAIKTAAESSADAAAASQSAAEASAKAVNAVVNPPYQAHAAGGMIRGPGTGTSDSILARLSNGEFVMRASAVRAWGADFMQSINGFSNGGLVRPIPRFAGGGMVTATTSDGVTVNLHFPGGTFALRGDAAIVGGLTREARRAGMLSAGRLAGALA